MEQFLFWLFAIMAVSTSLVVVAARNPLHSALALVAAFFALAGIYVLLHAHLLAAIQILVYAGAIMVLFVFVIMLLNLGDDDVRQRKVTLMKWLSGGALVIGGGALSWRAFRGLTPASDVPAGGLSVHADFGTVKAVGEALYGPFLLPFELTSLLLLVAIVGAVVVAKAKI